MKGMSLWKMAAAFLVLSVFALLFTEEAAKGRKEHFAFGPFSIGGKFDALQAQEHLGDLIFAEEYEAAESPDGDILWRTTSSSGPENPSAARGLCLRYSRLVFFLIDGKIRGMEISGGILRTDRGVGPGDFLYRVRSVYEDFSLRKTVEPGKGKWRLPKTEFSGVKSGLQIAFSGKNGRLSRFSVWAPPENLSPDAVFGRQRSEKVLEPPRRALQLFGAAAAEQLLLPEIDFRYGPFVCGEEFCFELADQCFGRSEDGMCGGEEEAAFRRIRFQLAGNRICSMEIADRNFTTPRGLRVGDPAGMVLKLYGVPDGYDEPARRLSYRAGGKGDGENFLDAVIDGQDRVSRIVMCCKIPSGGKSFSSLGRKNPLRGETFAMGPFRIGGVFRLSEAKDCFGDVLSFHEGYSLGRSNFAVFYPETDYDPFVSRQYTLHFDGAEFSLSDGRILGMKIGPGRFGGKPGAGRNLKIGDASGKIRERYRDVPLRKEFVMSPDIYYKYGPESETCSYFLCGRKEDLGLYFYVKDEKVLMMEAFSELSLYGKFWRPVSWASAEDMKTVLADNIPAGKKPPGPLSAQSDFRYGPFACREPYDASLARCCFGAPVPKKYPAIKTDVPYNSLAEQVPRHFFRKAVFGIYEGVVAFIDVTDRHYGTARGLRVGDGLEKVLELYGPPVGYKGGVLYYYCYGEGKITRSLKFTIDRRREVSRITMSVLEEQDLFMDSLQHI